MSKWRLWLIIVAMVVLVFICISFVNIKIDNSLTSQGLSIRKYLGVKDNKFSGKGITIAVLDSGLSEHNDISSDRILCFKDFVNSRTSIYDDNGHGSFVTGIIGANGSAKGVASNVNFVIAKVLDENGQTVPETFLTALEWIVDNSDNYNIKVVNISFGVEKSSIEYYAKDIESLINELNNQGIFVISSVGNNPNSISYPSSLNNVISVGSINNNYTYDTDDDKKASFSPQSMDKPDLVTLGVDIMSIDNNNYRGYKYKSGTSYSSAIISGLVAIYLEENDEVTINELIDFLDSN